MAGRILKALKAVTLGTDDPLRSIGTFNREMVTLLGHAHEPTWMECRSMTLLQGRIAHKVGLNGAKPSWKQT